ncbi:ABC transporter ATP-binding protein [Desulfovibrio ferrophilus]|uniref:Toluene ABC transporter ATP-binding protein n=1 Tax=Desulfovibrio ferrophilus TaxID=241368 RepID=A0A2Z6B149_9BACT|nr:ABC transporter ATP-binding protein [Desulfovibrio ferrophilus]BBD09232.1 toluene ABC transporter ATP-binding protein [Desulfovibrio ferrophilus]
MGLRLTEINKSVDQEMHLADVSLELEAGSRYIILGRTLAGKTSLLRIMAGLDRPGTGTVLADGQDVTGVSVRKRDVAMVYQQFINYPSLTIYDNIASPLKMAGVSKAEIDRRVREVAKTLQLDPLLDRLPAELSGGQQQRTAIARALVKESHLLLLDEPLVNLDYKLREELREELQHIFKERESIVVYTTTEPTEALMMGGNVVVMDEGRILQIGKTPEVFNHPCNMKVAEVFSDPPMNFIPARIEGEQARLSACMKAPLVGALKDLGPGEYTFGVRASRVFLNQRHDSDIGLCGEVSLSEINGSETFIHVGCGRIKLVAQEDGIHKIESGSNLPMFVNPEDFYVFDGNGDILIAPSAID